MEKNGIVECFDNEVSRSLTAGAKAVRSIDDITLSDEQSAVYLGMSQAYGQRQTSVRIAERCYGKR